MYNKSPPPSTSRRRAVENTLGAIKGVVYPFMVAHPERIVNELYQMRQGIAG